MNKNRKPLKRPSPGDVIRKDSDDDYTGPTAQNRVFYINFLFMKFGTTDRLQGAAMFLSVILLFFIIIAIVLGFFFNADWAKEAIAWLGTPLLLVIGVAVGRGAKPEINEES